MIMQSIRALRVHPGVQMSKQADELLHRIMKESRTDIIVLNHTTACEHSSSSDFSS